MPMSQKDKLSIIGSKTTIFGLLKPILSLNSQLLRDMPLASDFAYIAANGFMGTWFSDLPIRQLIISNL